MAYNVLLVDDSSITRSVIKKTISMTGIDIGDIYEAVDGINALEVLEQHWVDLVFADLNMPRMDGVELVEKMAESHILENTPVIVISSDRNQRRLVELQSRGIKGYINKPFRPEQLREIMMQVLGDKDASQNDE